MPIWAITVPPGARVELLRPVGGARDQFPLASADTEGRLSLVDHCSPAGTLTARLHRHARDLGLVLDGRMRAVYRSDDDEAGAGEGMEAAQRLAHLLHGRRLSVCLVHVDAHDSERQDDSRGTCDLLCRYIPWGVHVEDDEEDRMVTEVGLQDLNQALEDGALLLDVRDSDEYAEGHVPGAQLLPLSVLPVRMHEVPRDRPVYLVCQAGGRSAQAAQLLSGAGIDARSVSGGTAAWISSGRPTQTGTPHS